MHYPHDKSSPEYTVIPKCLRILKRNTVYTDAAGERGTN